MYYVLLGDRWRGQAPFLLGTWCASLDGKAGVLCGEEVMVMGSTRLRITSLPDPDKTLGRLRWSGMNSIVSIQSRYEGVGATDITPGAELIGTRSLRSATRQTACCGSRLECKRLSLMEVDRLIVMKFHSVR